MERIPGDRNMKITVYAPPFVSHDSLDEDGSMELEEGACLREVYRHLKVPPPLRPVLVCMVNYERVRRSTPLKDGDVVSFLTPLAGG